MSSRSRERPTLKRKSFQRSRSQPSNTAPVSRNRVRPPRARGLLADREFPLDLRQDADVATLGNDAIAEVAKQRSHRRADFLGSQRIVVVAAGCRVAACEEALDDRQGWAAQRDAVVHAQVELDVEAAHPVIRPAVFHAQHWPVRQNID